jgi:predicted nucleic acid-binding protein
VSGVVLDCSVAMAWCFEDEADAFAYRVLAQLEKDEAHVPGIWPVEVANVLLVAERMRRITSADSLRFLELLAALPIVIDEETAQRAFGSVLAVGRQTRLTAYDAAYLELALRRGLPLATRDRRLRSAGRREGVRVLA